MIHIARMIVIRSLYPYFLFKKGTVMHALFLGCLVILLTTSFYGISFLAKVPLESYSVPFATMLSYVVGLFGLWVLCVGIQYGLQHA